MADATTVSRRDFMKDTGIGSVAALAAGCTTPANILVPQGEILRYDVVVIGSGFGGTIAATELAATGKKVLILERGTWWISPEFLGAPPDPTGRPKPLRRWLEENKAPLQFWARPDHAEGLKDLFRAIRQPANPKGLYEYSTFGQAHVLTSSGVGGGSLIYSNVTLKPKDRVLAGLQAADLRLGPADWDAARMWTTTRRGVLNRIVTKIPLPKDKDAARLSKDDEYLYLDRSRALRNVAENVGRQVADDKTAEWLPLDLAVIEYDPTPGSDASKNHTFCERQGRCFLGCLPAARHTLNKTLYAQVLAKASNTATLWPLAEAEVIKRVPDGYQVRFKDHDQGVIRTAQAKTVFVAAGTLGSTALLLRSQRDGLPLSQALGTRFSTNGDFGAFVLLPENTPVYSTRGPINTCHVSMTVDNLSLNFEDCAIPAMAAEVASAALGVLGREHQQNLLSGIFSLWAKKKIPDHYTDLFGGKPPLGRPDRHPTEAEMVANILFFNVMGQDEANGTFTLKGPGDGTLDLDWARPVAEQPVYAKIEQVVRVFAKELGGTYVPFPLWQGLPKRKVITTHPLGGCPIGPTSAEGVVNSFGQVFDGSQPRGSTAVLPGLYIVDGSTIPGALAVNPTYTIMAQAVKAVRNALQGL